MEEKEWKYFIGDITLGRKNLGEEMPVSVYRLFEFTMRKTLQELYGKEEAIKIFKKAGEKAGSYLCEQLIDKNLDFNSFISQLQTLLQQLKVGILRVEEINEEANQIILSISEDLDCSGLPMTGETVCHYDEGFLSGILRTYTGNEYEVLEIDCWAKGGRVCRFNAEMKEQSDDKL